MRDSMPSVFAITHPSSIVIQLVREYLTPPQPSSLIIVNQSRLRRRAREMGLRRVPRLTFGNFDLLGYFNPSAYTVGISPRRIMRAAPEKTLAEINACLTMVLAHELRHAVQRQRRRVSLAEVIHWIRLGIPLSFGGWAAWTWWTTPANPIVQSSGTVFCGLAGCWIIDRKSVV